MIKELELDFDKLYSERIDQVMKREQEMSRETIFHDTVPLPLEQLEKGRRKAVREKDIILHFFRVCCGTNHTPHQVSDETGIFITNTRRSITDLTKEGKLIKCSWDEREMGKCGVDNRTWRYNENYIKPLNKL